MKSFFSHFSCAVAIDFVEFKNEEIFDNFLNY